MEENLIIFWLFSVVVFLTCILIYVGYVAETSEEEIVVPISNTQPFYDISLIAKAVIVKDVTTGNILYAKNENTPLPLASIAKVMTAYLSSKILDEEKSTKITQYALLADGEYAFEIGDSWPIKILRDVTLLKSANDGARALSIAAGETLTTSTEDSSKTRAFVDKMNELSKELGLKNTVFKNPSGLDIGPEASAIGSAYDISELFQYVLTKDSSILEVTAQQELRTVIAGENYR
jgi:D-alanyl-D-alanine carboxypeptidase